MDSKEVGKLSTNITALTSSVNALAKALPSANSQDNTSQIDGTSRFVKKEDPAKKFYKDSVASLKELIKIDKEILKNSTKKFGMALGLGGLAAWLLTGKEEFLNTAFKGLEKAFLMPVAKVFDKFVGKFAKSLLDSGGSIGKAIKGLFGFSAKELTKTMVEEGGKLAGKSVVKGLLKGGGKVGLKALQKIPILSTILGPVIGIYFAAERYKKGDYIGAMGEIASGVLSMVPGAGIFLSLGMDLVLALRDFKKPESIAKENTSKLAQISKNVLENLPGVSTVFHVKKMMDLWQTDKVGALKEGALAFGSFIPGFHLAHQIADWLGTKKETKISSLPTSFGSFGGVAGGLVREVKPTVKPLHTFAPEIESAIKKYSKEHPLVPENAIRAMIMKESSGNPMAEAYTGSRHGTARGLGQFIDSTAKQYIPDWKSPTDSYIPEKNVAGMFNYMDALIKKNKGNLREAFYDYHGRSDKPDALGKTSKDYSNELVSVLEKHDAKIYKDVTKNIILNPPAIDQKELANTLSSLNKPQTSLLTEKLDRLISVTQENSKTLQDTIKNNKITQKNSYSVGSNS